MSNIAHPHRLDNAPKEIKDFATKLQSLFDENETGLRVHPNQDLDNPEHWRLLVVRIRFVVDGGEFITQALKGSKVAKVKEKANTYQVKPTPAQRPPEKVGRKSAKSNNEKS